VLVIAFKMGLTLERKHGRGRDLARGAEKNIAGRVRFETPCILQQVARAMLAQLAARLRY